MNWKSLGHGAQIFDPHLSIFLKPEVIAIGDGARIDGLVKIEGGEGVEIGAYVHISSFAHVNIGGGSLIVGSYAAITSGVKIVTGSNVEAGRAMSSAAPREMQVVERKATVIGAYAFIGANAVILPGVTIGQGAIVGANSVVTKDIGIGEVWMGRPAECKRLRRNAEQFLEENELAYHDLLSFS